MLNPLDDVVRHQKAGEAFGVTSICSAHPLVLEAAMRQASDDGSHVLVEATSNQVDQFGGYTGMRPADFRDLVTASRPTRVSGATASCSAATTSARTAGGHLPPDEAMENAERPRRRLRRGRLHQDPPRLQLLLRRRPDAR